MYYFTNSQISTALNLLYRARYLATIVCDDNHPDIALLDLGEAHEKTQESSECLRHLTQQAVVLQKKMNDIYSNGKLTTGLPPIHILPPSMGSVLDMLNAINGIIFVQISSKEIANLKNEIEKRQKEGGAAGESSVAQANQEEEDRLLTETMVKTAAGIPFEEQEKYGQWRQPLMKPAENLTAF